MIHSLSTSLGTPVHPLIHAIILSANHVAAVQFTKSCRYRPRASGNVHINRQNGGKWCDPCDLDHGMIAGARGPDLSISITAVLMGCSHTAVSRKSLRMVQKRKYLESSSSVNRHALLKRVVNRAWPDWFELKERPQ